MDLDLARERGLRPLPHRALRALHLSMTMTRIRVGLWSLILIDPQFLGLGDADAHRALARALGSVSVALLILLTAAPRGRETSASPP